MIASNRSIDKQLQYIRKRMWDALYTPWLVQTQFGKIYIHVITIVWCGSKILPLKFMGDVNLYYKRL